MNIVDAVLCADVIEDARLEGGLVKLRAKLNKTYGRMRQEDSAFDEGYQYDPSYGTTDTQPPEYVELGEEGLPGIPTMG